MNTKINDKIMLLITIVLILVVLSLLFSDIKIKPFILFFFLTILIIYAFCICSMKFNFFNNFNLFLDNKLERFCNDDEPETRETKIVYYDYCLSNRAKKTRLCENKRAFLVFDHWRQKKLHEFRKKLPINIYEPCINEYDKLSDLKHRRHVRSEKLNIFGQDRRYPVVAGYVDDSDDPIMYLFDKEITEHELDNMWRRLKSKHPHKAFFDDNYSNDNDTKEPQTKDEIQQKVNKVPDVHFIEDSRERSRNEKNVNNQKDFETGHEPIKTKIV